MWRVLEESEHFPPNYMIKKLVMYLIILLLSLNTVFPSYLLFELIDIIDTYGQLWLMCPGLMRRSIYTP